MRRKKPRTAFKSLLKAAEQYTRKEISEAGLAYKPASPKEVKRLEQKLTKELDGKLEEEEELPF